jgi:iron-sulfur cluster repair protein YtfE (RIC family)
MTTDKMPGSEAARHGAGDADLTVMLAAHEAFRRDLVGLARAAGVADLADPGRRESVGNGWRIFKHQLDIHHSAEDDLIWPALRERLAHSENAQSVLDAMEDEHELIDPLLAAVDSAFDQRAVAPAGSPGPDRLADVVDALVTTLSSHLVHEERDALPLIGMTLTAAEWRSVGRQIARKNLSSGPEMFGWMLDGAEPERVKAALGELPPPVRLIYRGIWKPRFARTSRW